jgi:MFS transporter, MHS family, proline/betaine transporter
VSSYVFITFMPTFAAQSLGIAPITALSAVICGSIANVLVVPLSGLALDRWGGRGPLLVSAGGFALLSIPLFTLVAAAPTFPSLVAVAIVSGVLYGIYNGAAPTILSLLFPTSVRYTALSVGYNGAVMIFGGFAPFICTFLVRESGSSIAPSFYVTTCAVISLAVLVWPRRRDAYAY